MAHILSYSDLSACLRPPPNSPEPSDFKGATSTVNYSEIIKEYKRIKEIQEAARRDNHSLPATSKDNNEAFMQG